MSCSCLAPSSALQEHERPLRREAPELLVHLGLHHGLEVLLARAVVELKEGHEAQRLAAGPDHASDHHALFIVRVHGSQDCADGGATQLTMIQLVS
jgi:hypothetical protein